MEVQLIKEPISLCGESETNKEEQVIENVTYMVKVETDQMKRLQDLVSSWI